MVDPSKAEDLIKIIESTRPDVLCLQEVSNLESVKLLGRRLKMFYRLSASADGMAVLSRLPITRRICKKIPNSYFNSLVAVESGGVWIASIHLNSESYKRNEAIRLKETEWLLKHFNPRIGIMAGDWNSVSHLDYVREGKAVKFQPSNVVEKQGWVDTHRAKPQSTWMQAKPDNIERIDRIYYRPLKKWRVLGQKTLGPKDFPFLRHGWPTGRDHRLVMCELVQK
jgi:endonuclease/exonuclease/phosphatase family metal-dependent hydrolase